MEKGAAPAGLAPVGEVAGLPGELGAVAVVLVGAAEVVVLHIDGEKAGAAGAFDGRRRLGVRVGGGRRCPGRERRQGVAGEEGGGQETEPEASHGERVGEAGDWRGAGRPDTRM